MLIAKGGYLNGPDKDWCFFERASKRERTYARTVSGSSKCIQQNGVSLGDWKQYARH